METKPVSELYLLTHSKELTADFDLFTEQVLEMLVSELTVPYAGLWLAQHSENRFTCLKSLTNSKNNPHSGVINGQDFKDLVSIMDNAEILMQHDINNHNWNVPCLSKYLTSGILSWMCQPLRISGEIFAFICVGQSIKHVWDNDDQQMLFSASLLLKQSYYENYFVDKAKLPVGMGMDYGENMTRINDQITDYVFYTAHNLRHPITNILALIEMVKELEKNGDSQQEMLELLKIEAMKLDDVVRIMVAKLDMNEHTV